MAQNPETTQVTPPAAAPASGGSNKLLLVIILASNVMMMGAVLFFVMRKPSAPAHGPTPAAAAENSAAGEHGAPAAGGEGGTSNPANAAPGPVLKLDNFIIQLRAADQDRYVRISFDLEVNTDADTEIVKRRLAHIRDLVISYFSDRTLEELRGSEGIVRTKEALLKRLDELIPGKHIRAIYITDFIIQ